jgi:hypothetical protein
VHKIVTPEEARRLQRTISNYRRIQALLAQWEEETAAEVLIQEEDNDSST